MFRFAELNSNGIIIISFKKIGSKVGLSEIETKVFSFVIISLIVGAIAYYAKYSSEIVEPKVYNYSKQDSLFWNNSESKKESNFTKKKVDYKQELYDFSDNELESIRTKINVNNANAKELETLPGIGKKTAEKIIIYIKKNGKFRSVNDLTKVSGIGEKKLEKIKNFIFIE